MDMDASGPTPSKLRPPAFQGTQQLQRPYEVQGHLYLCQWSQVICATGPLYSNNASSSSARTANGSSSNRKKIEASDKKLIDEPLPKDADSSYAANDHMGNFIDCVRSRKKPICDVEVGHRS